MHDTPRSHIQSKWRKLSELTNPLLMNTMKKIIMITKNHFTADNKSSSIQPTHLVKTNQKLVKRARYNLITVNYVTSNTINYR